MNNIPVKAIAVFDRRVNPWFLESIAADGSVDCHLIDVEEFIADVEKFDSALEQLQNESVDVVLLDSALPLALLMKMTMRVRDKAPSLPVLLLPTIDAKDGSWEMSSTNLHGSTDAIYQTMTKAIRFARNRQQLQLELAQLALKDDLTGLHNRRGFLALAKQQLRLARTMKQQLLLFFADVDGLKQINDRFGHHEGDHALRRTADSFKKTFRESDITARLCGDEFVALMIESPKRNAETISRRLQLNLTRCAVKEPRYRLSLSIGVARFDPQTASSLQELMSQADKALYAQKRKGLSLAQTNSTITLANAKQQQQLNGMRPGANHLSMFNARVTLPAPIVREQRPVGSPQESEEVG